VSSTGICRDIDVSWGFPHSRVLESQTQLSLQTPRLLPVSLEKVASTDMVQLASPHSRQSHCGFGESAESPRALLCCFEFYFKTWQSLSVLALCDSTGSWSPLHNNSAGSDISKADGEKK